MKVKIMRLKSLIKRLNEELVKARDDMNIIQSDCLHRHRYHIKDKVHCEDCDYDLGWACEKYPTQICKCKIKTSSQRDWFNRNKECEK